MKTIVRFEFDNQIFHENYYGPSAIILENPPHIPHTGDTVDFNIKDFLSDENVLESYQSVKEVEIFYAHRVQTKYSRDLVEITIMVCPESIFKIIFPQLF